MRSYLENLGRAATAAGHSLTIVAPGAADEVSREGSAKLIRYRSPPMPYDPTYRAPIRIDLMRRIAIDERPEVLQVSSPFSPAVAVRLVPHGPLRVYHHHSDPIGCYVRPTLHRYLSHTLAEQLEQIAWSWVRSVCLSCDATVVAGAWLERQLAEHACERVFSVPFGISKVDLGPSRRSVELRRKLMGHLADVPDATLLLISGRLAVDKRQGMLIDALVRLNRHRPVALVVLGDGPERERLVTKAAQLAHATFQPFTRNRADYAAILASVDALVHGSVCETFGFVVAESLASGTPVVVPDAGGAAALAQHDCAEMYSSTAGADEACAAIERLLRRPRVELCDAAVRRAGTFPSSERHFQDLFDLYERLLRERVPEGMAKATH